MTPDTLILSLDSQRFVYERYKYDVCLQKHEKGDTPDVN